MDTALPRYLLLCETLCDAQGAPRWRFVLHQAESDHTLSASDNEPDSSQERLELWAVVRGLEALAQPSRVALVSSSNYVRRGLDRGVAEWRAARWKWECFGRRVLVRDHDLWRRVDRALEIHQVLLRGEAVSVGEPPAAAVTPALPSETVAPPVRRSNRLRFDRSHEPAALFSREPAVMIVRGKRGHSVRLNGPQEALPAAAAG